MREKSEIVRIMQNIIDEAEENIIRAEDSEYGNCDNIKKRREDLYEAIDLVNELQEDGDGISAGSN